MVVGGGGGCSTGSYIMVVYITSHYTGSFSISFLWDHYLHNKMHASLILPEVVYLVNFVNLGLSENVLDMPPLRLTSIFL